MINGHGDDAYLYDCIRHNFSSNIYSHVDLSELYLSLWERLNTITSYPEPEAWSLESVIAERCGLEKDCVLVTAGATDAIYMIAEEWKDLKVEIVEPTFSEYRDASVAAGAHSGSGGMLWLCNPNNPTGDVVSKDEVLRMASEVELLVLDQSYENYTMDEMLSPADAVEACNILQLHSLTKSYCIPGLRIGYVVGATGLISRLRKRLRPWSVNTLAIEAAMWLIGKDFRVLPEKQTYLSEAQHLRSLLDALPYISVEPTHTNFMLCRIDEHTGVTACMLKEQLARRYGILIRDASNFRGLTPYHFRVAAQTPEENRLLVDGIREIIQPTSSAEEFPTSQYASTSKRLRPVMLAGTGSDVGKSIVATALCRIFRQDGYNSAPFKAQNMALNSYATREGLEMGRAQAVQAEAAGIECHTDMNPLLLKPQGDHTSQVVLHGRVIGTRDAYDYFKEPMCKSYNLRQEVCGAFDRLAARYNPIVMEGAGSISEINLRNTDLVNLPMARHADAAVFLVADIDRGGVFASVYGSIKLQTEEDRARIKGIIINKFRGDLRLFDNGRRLLEELCGVPVLGVIPYMNDLHIEEEDSVALSGKKRSSDGHGVVSVAVVLLRHISNYTDFDALENDSRVNLFYTNNVEDLKSSDIIIVPGSKTTLSDLAELRRSGCAAAIVEAYRKGSTVIGICGGYQMLGYEVCDPDHVEGDIERLPGLGLLPVRTTMNGNKVTRQVHFVPAGSQSSPSGNADCRGYEIHMGTTSPSEGFQESPFAVLSDGSSDGYRVNSRLWGTYLHGALDNAAVVDDLLSPFMDRFSRDREVFDYAAFKEQEYNRLADHVRKHLDMEKVYSILSVEGSNIG